MISKKKIKLECNRFDGWFSHDYVMCQERPDQVPRGAKFAGCTDSDRETQTSRTVLSSFSSNLTGPLLRLQIDLLVLVLTGRDVIRQWWCRG